MQNLSCKSNVGDLIFQRKIPCCSHRDTLIAERGKDVFKLHIARKVVLSEILEVPDHKHSEHTR